MTVQLARTILTLAHILTCYDQVFNFLLRTLWWLTKMTVLVVSMCLGVLLSVLTGLLGASILGFTMAEEA